MSATPGTVGGNGQASGIPEELYFITAPQDISWEKGSKHRVIETYGSNAPYISYGNTGLRKLSLNDCMIEGFSDGKQIEGNIADLEACQLMVISPDGYTSPFVWNVFGGSKNYGNFVITDISIKEVMRDMSGKATRAFADVSLIEVPAAQVASGADITATAVTGSIDPKFQADLVAQDQTVSATRATNAGGKGRGGAGGAGGAGANATPGGPRPPASGTGIPQTGEEIYEQTARDRGDWTQIPQ